MRTGRLWVLVAVALAAVGSIGSFVGASTVADRDGAAERRRFESESAAAAADVDTALERQSDLVTNLSGQVLEKPGLTTSGLDQWLGNVRAEERFPELVSVVVIAPVTAAELPEHVEAVMADPPGPLQPGEQFAIVPAGERPVYCLVRANFIDTATITLPVGFDLCANGGDEMLLPLIDGGTELYMPVDLAGTETLSIVTPVYRGGAVPATLEERRASFVALVATSFRPDIVLDGVRRRHPDLTFQLAIDDRFDQSNDVGIEIGSALSFSTGDVADGDDQTVESLGGGWSLTVSRPAIASGILARDASTGLLVSGVVVSLLAGVLVLVLGTGRARALRLVARATDDLPHQALHDTLTGLANRALLADRLTQLLARSRRSETVPAALYLDLDGFKGVNDGLGHEAGDRLLCQVADRMVATVRDADAVARVGGDEFVILLDGAVTPFEPMLVAERLIQVLQEPFDLGGGDPVHISASVGVAVGDRAAGDELLRDADTALYQSKANGKNRATVFQAEMLTTATRGRELEIELRQALARGQFHLDYQPTYDLHDLSVVGVEALLRWDHPHLGSVEPVEFIPLLERSGQIVEVGRWVLRQACEQMVAWNRSGAGLTMAVNIAGRQLDTEDLVHDVAEVLAETGLPPAQLTLEITESELMHTLRSNVERLEAIKRPGVRVAIDDFGTGYSSLAALQRLPVDCLKIDRSFITGVASAPEARAVVRTIVQLGRDLGLRTLAEGVEEIEQVDRLRGDEVDEIQGFLMARPAPAADIERLLFGSGRPVTPTA